MRSPECEPANLDPDLVSHPQTILTEDNILRSWSDLTYKEKIDWLIANNRLKPKISFKLSLKPGYGKHNRRRGRGGSRMY